MKLIPIIMCIFMAAVIVTSCKCNSDVQNAYKEGVFAGVAVGVECGFTASADINNGLSRYAAIEKAKSCAVLNTLTTLAESKYYPDE